MNPAEVGIQRMTDRLALAAHEPATWAWLGASIIAIVIYAYASFALTRDAGDLEQWLALALSGLVFWIIAGWMVELFTFDARGHLSYILGWRVPVVLAFALGGAWRWMLFQSPRRKTITHR